MELREICKIAQEKHGLTQNELAARLGLQKGHLSSAINGRRGLPAEAAFELEDLTGIPAREIYRLGKARAAQGGAASLCLMIAAWVASVVVSLFMSAGTAGAAQTGVCEGGSTSSTPYARLQRPACLDPTGGLDCPAMTADAAGNTAG